MRWRLRRQVVVAVLPPSSAIDRTSPSRFVSALAPEFPSRSRPRSPMRSKIRWTELAHAYGSATDVAALLYGATLGDDQVRREAWWELWGNIHHQGTVYIYRHGPGNDIYRPLSLLRRRTRTGSRRSGSYARLRSGAVPGPKRSAKPHRRTRRSYSPAGTVTASPIDGRTSEGTCRLGRGGCARCCWREPGRTIPAPLIRSAPPGGPRRHGGTAPPTPPLTAGASPHCCIAERTRKPGTPKGAPDEVLRKLPRG